MYAMSLREIATTRKLSKSAKILVMYFASYTGMNGQFRRLPLKKIMSETGMCEATVLGATKELIANGIVDRQGKSNQVKRYRINPGVGWMGEEISNPERNRRSTDQMHLRLVHNAS